MNQTPKHLQQYDWCALIGADLIGADLISADLTDADLTRADLTDANLTGADLIGANLIDADLIGANLTRANLTDADLTGADLSGANLSGANLSGAVLSGANLSGADLTDARGVATREECVAMLDEIRVHVIEHGDRLYMSSWHGSDWSPSVSPEHACETSHCLAGWAQALSPDPEVRRLDPVTAGVRLIPLAAPRFWDDDPDALSWLRDREYA